MIIKDKDWLDRIFVAYKVYPVKDPNIKNFILWLYKQYGIIPPKDFENE